MQVGVDLVARLVGVTLGPRGRNVVLQNPYGPPKIVKDGETVLREVVVFLVFITFYKLGGYMVVVSNHYVLLVNFTSRKIELDDPMENLGVKLVRQAGAKTNSIAGDGCTSSIILAQGLIAEGVKVLYLPVFVFGSS